MTLGYANHNGQNRFTHLVGGFPGDSTRGAMAQLLEYLGPTLLYLPDGETATPDIPDRPDWIAPELRGVSGLRGVRMCFEDARYEGYDTGYENVPYYQPTEPLAVADFAQALILQQAFEASYPVFCELRGEREASPLRFQAGTPSAFDLALLAFRDEGLDADLLNPITQAKAQQVRACHAQAPGDVVFQLETPAATRWVATAADPAKEAAYVAGLLTELPRLCSGTAWGVHLCLGDWNHQSAVDPDSAMPLVVLAKEIIAQWPAGIPDAPVLEYVHLPFAAASKPPAADPEWYAPLADLRSHMPPGARLVAGLVHEDLDLPALRRLLAIIEAAYGAQVTIAATCGLGRRPGDDHGLGQAVDALTKMAALSAAA
jgi:hypothetical protein